MSTVVALGDDHRLEGYALAGATVVHAATDDQVRRTWHALGSDVGLVVLDRRAADAIQSVRDERPDVLTAVLP